MEREFRRYLDCGILAHGFARARCGECGHTVLIAFSCNGRGGCPSCNARRMAEVAAPLMEQVFPVLPVRQWVLSIPKRLRYFLPRDPAALSAVLHILLRAIEARLREASHCPDGRLGAVSFVHRFGAALNAHVHCHCCIIDGVLAAAVAPTHTPDAPGRPDRRIRHPFCHATEPRGTVKIPIRYPCIAGSRSSPYSTRRRSRDEQRGAELRIELKASVLGEYGAKAIRVRWKLRWAAPFRATTVPPTS